MINERGPVERGRRRQAADSSARRIDPRPDARSGVLEAKPRRHGPTDRDVDDDPARRGRLRDLAHSAEDLAIAEQAVPRLQRSVDRKVDLEDLAGQAIDLVGDEPDRLDASGIAEPHAPGLITDPDLIRLDRRPGARRIRVFPDHTDEHIAIPHRRADADDAALVQGGPELFREERIVRTARLQKVRDTTDLGGLCEALDAGQAGRRRSAEPQLVGAQLGVDTDGQLGPRRAVRQGEWKVFRPGCHAISFLRDSATRRSDQAASTFDRSMSWRRIGPSPAKRSDRDRSPSHRPPLATPAPPSERPSERSPCHGIRGACVLEALPTGALLGAK